MSGLRGSVQRLFRDGIRATISGVELSTAHLIFIYYGCTMSVQVASASPRKGQKERGVVRAFLWRFFVSPRKQPCRDSRSYGQGALWLLNPPLRRGEVC